MVYEAWKRGVLARGIPVLRAHYGRKRDAMSRALQRDLGGVVTWLDARGGFFMWVELPARLDAERLLPAAVQERVAYVPGAPFFVDGSGRHTLRLSFALPTPERIDDGVGRLARVVRRALGGVR
jgi:2-aminoadipate transaminase